MDLDFEIFETEVENVAQYNLFICYYLDSSPNDPDSPRSYEWALLCPII
jgi:hypothetical protein